MCNIPRRRIEEQTREAGMNNRRLMQMSLMGSTKARSEAQSHAADVSW